MAPLLAAHPRAVVIQAIRLSLEQVRASLEGPEGAQALPGSPEAWAGLVRTHLDALQAPSLQGVINATGVVLHTNLGRAPLASEARDAMAQVALGYSNLEFDLESGTRGSRYDHCVDLLTELTGAEDALVVNNCAAALVLALSTVARGRGVTVSRGELVEIGGGFRIPEMLDRAGSRLVEVGATNRTRVGDYRSAVDDHGDVAALLKVHRSNFRITGFTEEATISELGELGAETDLPVIFDLGSGLLVDPATLGLPEEPTPRQALAEGADLVVVSGDKLLGGPQAGLVVGSARLVERMRSNPLCRAFRVDKVTLAGLEATLRLYRDPDEARKRIPTLRMIAASAEALRGRAQALSDRLAAEGVGSEVVDGRSLVGGGTFPGVELPSAHLRLLPPEGGESPGRLAQRLRSRTLPVVARLEDDGLLFDLRTVDPAQEEALVEAIAQEWGR